MKVYIATNKDNKDTLMHYGVKGMKWGRKKWSGDDDKTGLENNINLISRHIANREVQNHGTPRNLFQLAASLKRVTNKGKDVGSKYFTRRTTGSHETEQEGTSVRTGNKLSANKKNRL